MEEENVYAMEGIAKEETPAEVENEVTTPTKPESKEYTVVRIEKNKTSFVRGVTNIAGVYCDENGNNVNNAWWFTTMRDARALLTLCKLAETSKEITFKICCRTSTIELY